MGRTIVKLTPDPADDRYVEWSSIVEAPTFMGSRTEMLAHICAQGGDQFPPDRLDRADRWGTSARFPPASIGPLDMGWDDHGVIVEQRGWLLRKDFSAFFDAWFADRHDDAYALLEPFDD